MSTAGSTHLTVLALDVGTSGSRAALVGATGDILSTGHAAHPTRTVGDKGVEQDPEDWLASARSAVRDCLTGCEDRPAALALTGQMQDLVLLGSDPAGRGALSPAILYSDTRAADDADAIHAAVPGWDELTGAVQGATSVAAMARRLRRVRPAAVADAEAVAMGPAGYLAWLLTGQAWCDVTTASATGLWDRVHRRWSVPVADAAGLRLEILPRLADGPALGTVVGVTGTEAVDLLGVPPGVPIVIAPGDAAATTSGIVGADPGEGYAYLGSSGWMAWVPEAASSGGDGDPGVQRLALPRRDRSAHHPALHIAPLLSAGAAAVWARETFCDGASPQEADRQLTARQSQRGRGPSGLLALPSIHGERYPVRDDELRAAVIGMEASTRGIDIYAAVLEGVAHALAHALPDTGIARLPVCGGGATSAPWRRILADVTGLPVVAVEEADAPLIGAAIAGAEALGLTHDIRPLTQRGAGEVTRPDASAHAAYARDAPAHRALYEAVGQVTRLRGAR